MITIKGKSALTPSQFNIMSPSSSVPDNNRSNNSHFQNHIANAELATTDVTIGFPEIINSL